MYYILDSFNQKQTKMMIYRILYSIGFLILIPSFLFSQNSDFKKVNKRFNDFEFIEAIDSYKKIINQGKGSIEVYQKLGDAYYYNSDLENAGKWYQKMFEYRTEQLNDSIIVEELQPEYYYKAAHCYKHLEKYDEAKRLITLAKESNANDSRSKRLEENQDYLEDIEKQSGRYEISDFENNSAFTDFAPSFYQNELVFSSSRGKRKNISSRNSWNQQAYLGLFQSIKDDSIGVSFSREFAKELSSRLHESTSSFSKDGNVIYFTRNNISKGTSRKDSLGVNRLKIFKAFKTAEQKWSQPEELPFNNDQYSVAHPTLNSDGTKLYFASDMPGGYGESDLYVVDINNDGSYGEPKNLGPEINTEGRDTFPFITTSGMLYFASDGHLGLGGLDIFVTNTTASEKKVDNIGKPVNSNYDDVTFIINEDTKEGYFASNRKGGRGDDDIYRITQNSPLVTDCIGYVSGLVKDQNSQEILVETEIEVLNQDKETIFNGKTNEEGFFYVPLDCNNKSFEFLLTKTKYKPLNISIDTNNDNPIANKDFFLEKDTPKTGVDLGKVLSLKPIYFASNKALILSSTAEELDKIVSYLKEFPSLKIEIRSHTDSKGSDLYNLKLSAKRATATAKYIIAKGINPNRVKSKGYGELQLKNDCKNGIPCSKERHQQNRRSEFIVIEN